MWAVVRDWQWIPHVCYMWIIIGVLTINWSINYCHECCCLDAMIFLKITWYKSKILELFAEELFAERLVVVFLQNFLFKYHACRLRSHQNDNTNLDRDFSANTMRDEDDFSKRLLWGGHTRLHNSPSIFLNCHPKQTHPIVKMKIMHIHHKERQFLQ